MKVLVSVVWKGYESRLPKTPPLNMVGKWINAKQEARSSCVQEEDLPTDSRRQGCCSPGKAGRAGMQLGGKAGLVTIRAEIPTCGLTWAVITSWISAMKKRQCLQRDSFQWYYLCQLFFFLCFWRSSYQPCFDEMPAETYTELLKWLNTVTSNTEYNCKSGTILAVIRYSISA